NGATTIVSPGTGGGTLSVSGTYTNYGILVINVDANAGLNDLLNVTGAVTLNPGGANQGTLMVNTVNNPPGNTYNIIKYGVLNGDFATKILRGQYTTQPNGPNNTYQLNGNGNIATVAAAPAVTGLNVATG